MEALTLLGAFLGASIWLMRFVTQQQKVITERFILHLETMLEKQQNENRLNRGAIRQLTGAVRRNSQLIRQVCKEGRCGLGRYEGDDKEQVQDKRNGV